MGSWQRPGLGLVKPCQSLGALCRQCLALVCTYPLLFAATYRPTDDWLASSCSSSPSPRFHQKSQPPPTQHAPAARDTSPMRTTRDHSPRNRDLQSYRARTDEELLLASKSLHPRGLILLFRGNQPAYRRALATFSHRHLSTPQLSRPPSPIARNSAMQFCDTPAS